MPLNFLGLGISFGAEDKGLSAMMDKLAATSQNLTTSFEADMTIRAKVAKHTLANLGVDTAKFTGQATSMSLGLNISADAAAQAIGAWDRAQGSLNKTGLQGAKDLAKLAEVTGTNVSVLRDTGVQMKKLGASDEDIAGMLDTMAKMGQVTGDVGGALNSLPQIMQQVQQKAALMGTKLDPKQLAAYVKQEAALSAAFSLQGKSAEEARQQATSLTDAMLGSQENLQNMFAGTSGDLDAFGQNLGIALGDAQAGFKLIKGGPADFMKNLTEMVGTAKKSGRLTAESFNMLRGQLKQALGPTADTVVNFLQTADDTTLKMMKDVQTGAKGTLKALADAHTTGYTFADQIRIAKDSMVSSFRSISREQTKTFVKDTTENFKKFANKLHELSARGGPVGALIDKLSLMHQIGALALLPASLRPFAAVLGDEFKELAPLIPLLPMLLGGLSSIAGALLGPLGLVLAAGAVVGWFVKLRREGMSTGQALKHMRDTVVDLIHKIDFKAVGKKISDFVSDLPIYANKAAIVGRQVWDEFVKPIGQALLDGLDQIPWGEIGEKMANLAEEYIPPLMMKMWKFNFRLMFSTLPGLFLDALKSLPGIFSRFTQFLVDMFDSLLDTIGDTVKQAFGPDSVVTDFVFTTIDNLKVAAEGVKYIFDKIAQGLGLLGGILKDKLQPLYSLVDKITGSGIMGPGRTTSVSVAGGGGVVQPSPISPAASSGGVGGFASRTGPVGSLAAPVAAAVPVAAKKVAGMAQESVADLVKALHSPNWYFNDLKPLLEKIARSAGSSSQDMGLLHRIGVGASGIPTK